MRKVTTALLLLFIGWGVLSAQEATDESKTFIGAWQYCNVSQTGDNAQITPMPIYKIFSSDGSFYVINGVNRGSFTVISNTGTYDVKSPTSYVERVNETAVDKQLVKKDNVLEYRIMDKDYMLITYRMPGATKDAHEMWKRVSILKLDKK